MKEASSERETAMSIQKQGWKVFLVLLIGGSLLSFFLSSSGTRFFLWGIEKLEKKIHLVFDYPHQMNQQFQAKLKMMSTLREENIRLKKDNASLRIELESHLFLASEKTQRKESQLLAKKLEAETGSESGRKKAPFPELSQMNFNSVQELVLGMIYFKAKDYERAAALFTRLQPGEEEPLDRTLQYYLVTAVSWYHLKNYKMADQYLDQVLKKKETPLALPYFAQCRLWKALVAHRLEKHVKVQYWLQELIDHHPHSREANWINPWKTKTERGGG